MRTPINGLSHVQGVTDAPLLELTIPEVLERAVARFAGRNAAVFSEEGIRWTYQELQQSAKGGRLGRWLAGAWRAQRGSGWHLGT